MLSSKDNYKENVDSLKRIVSQGDMSAADQWFKDNNFDKNSSEAYKFAKALAGRTYFFSFIASSNAMSKADLDAESLRREVAILKHFDLKSQLEIFVSLYIHDEVKIEHIRALDYSSDRAEDKTLVSKSVWLDSIWTQFFSKEKFKEFEEVESMLGLSLLDKKMNHAQIFYKEKNISGSFTVSLGKKVFKPYFDIIFNYSDAKKKYILDSGLPLLYSKECDELLTLIKEKMRNDPMFNKPYYFDMLHEKTQKYLSFTMHENLIEILKDNPSKNKHTLKI